EHPEPGPVGAAVPVPGSAGDPPAVDGRGRPRQAAGAGADGALAPGSGVAAGGDGRARRRGGAPAVRHRDAADGGAAAAGQGRGLHPQRDRGARRQGRARPAHRAAGDAGRAAAGRARTRQGVAPRRPGGRLRRGLAAACAGAQVSVRRARVRLAVRVPRPAPLEGSARRRRAPPPPGRRGGLARDPQGAAAGSMALLSIMPEAAAAEIIRANAERYVSHPAVRPLDAELVTRQVAEARARGYAVNMGYYFPGEGGLGLPIRRRHHYEVDVAVSFNAPLELMTEEWIASIIKELRNCLGREILDTHQQRSDERRVGNANRDWREQKNERKRKEK